MKEKKVFKMEDPKFVRTITKIYSYVYPFAFGIMTVLLLFSGAFVSSLCFAVPFVLTLPQTRDFFEKIRIKGLLKLVLCVGMSLLGLYSTILYV